MISKILSVKNHIHTRQQWIYPLTVLLVATIAIGVSICFEDGISNDAVKYRKMVVAWIESQDIYWTSEDAWAATVIPPFFLWIVKCITGLFHVDIFTAARIVNVTCGIFSPLAFYYLIKCFTPNRSFAFFCAVVLACHPSFVYICTILTRDSLYFFLATLTLLCIAAGIMHKKWWSCAIAGLTFAAAVFTRYETLELLPCFGILLVFCVLGKKISWQRGFASLVIFISSALVTAVLLGYIMGFHADYMKHVKEHYTHKILRLM